MTAIELICPTCDQQPYYCCEWKKGSFEDRSEWPTFHASRIEAAAAMTRSSNPVSREEFNEAVLSTGLV